MYHHLIQSKFKIIFQSLKIGKYNDCLHFNEPYDSCTVKQGVSSGLVSAERYESYLRIMGDVLGEKDYERILNEVAPDLKKKLVLKNKRN